MKLINNESIPRHIKPDIKQDIKQNQLQTIQNVQESSITGGNSYYDYSQQQDISQIIREKFSDLRPNATYPNDSDTLPQFNDDYTVTNPWHQLTGILSEHTDIDIFHRDTADLIEKNIPFIYLIGIRSGPQNWGTDDRNKLFLNIKQHTSYQLSIVTKLLQLFQVQQ